MRVYSEYFLIDHPVPEKYLEFESENDFRDFMTWFRENKELFASEWIWKCTRERVIFFEKETDLMLLLMKGVITPPENQPITNP